MKMRKILKNSKGITLIALVITIVILLILAGISISALTQTGLFGRAKQAEQVSKEKQEEENATLGTYEDEIDKYLGDKSSTGEKLVDKVNDGKIKIGDYVKYTPDTVLTTDKSYTDLLSNLEKYSGSTLYSVTQETNLNWRVLDVTDDGQVRLISDKPTTSKITLYGYKGYNNAVKLLDDACSVLYTNNQLTSNVQNIKIKDIQNKMTEKDDSKLSTVYGKRFDIQNTKYYPLIFLKEKDQKTISKDNVTFDGNELDVSAQDKFVEQNDAVQANSLNVKHTDWWVTMNKDKFEKEKYYEIFINNGNNYAYWISSRCVSAGPAAAVFKIRMVTLGAVGSESIYASSGDNYDNETARTYAFRPVVTLNSNVQIDTANSGDGTTAAQGYAIK